MWLCVFHSVFSPFISPYLSTTFWVNPSVIQPSSLTVRNHPLLVWVSASMFVCLTPSPRSSLYWRKALVVPFFAMRIRAKRTFCLTEIQENSSVSASHTHTHTHRRGFTSWIKTHWSALPTWDHDFWVLCTIIARKKMKDWMQGARSLTAERLRWRSPTHAEERKRRRREAHLGCRLYPAQRFRKDGQRGRGGGEEGRHTGWYKLIPRGSGSVSGWGVAFKYVAKAPQ